MGDHYRWDGDDLILHCHLQPKAARDGFAGVHGGRLKLRIAAVPVEGRANARLIKFLSQTFGVAKSQVTIVRGWLGRQKTLRIQSPSVIPAEAAIERKK